MVIRMQEFSWVILSHSESGMFHPTTRTVARLLHPRKAVSSVNGGGIYVPACRRKNGATGLGVSLSASSMEGPRARAIMDAGRDWCGVPEVDTNGDGLPTIVTPAKLVPAKAGSGGPGPRATRIDRAATAGGVPAGGAIAAAGRARFKAGTVCGKMGGMATFPELSYLGEATRWQRFKRDLHLIRFMVAVFWRWSTEGRRVRRAYRRARARGTTLWLDDLDPFRGRAGP